MLPAQPTTTLPTRFERYALTMGDFVSRLEREHRRQTLRALALPALLAAAAVLALYS